MAFVTLLIMVLLPNKVLANIC